MNYFKFEFKRAIKNLGFYFSISVGIILSLLHIIFCVIPEYNMQDNYVSRFEYPSSVYNLWISMDMTSIFTIILFFLVPILSAIPYATSYLKDKKSGYQSVICSKVGIKKYYQTKFLVQFSVSGLIIVIPLLFDFLATGLFLPFLIPQASTALFPIGDKSFCSVLYYEKPLLYVLLYLILDFLIIGSLESVSFFTCLFSDNSFIVIMSPFIVFVSLFFLTDLFENYGFNTFSILQASQPADTGIIFILLEILIFLFLSILSIYILRKRNEVH